MPQKQGVQISFQQGIDTKSDPKQIPLGRFLDMRNSVFNKGGLFQKRNGFGNLTLLPNTDSSYITTFKGNLTSVSNSILALSSSTNTWVSKGHITPLSLNVTPLIRSNTNQSQADISVAANGLLCVVYTDQNPASLGASVYKYAIINSVTGQNIVSPTLIPVNSGTVTGSPKVFLLGNYFIIVFTNVVTATSHLQYIAISTSNPLLVTANADIASAYVSATTVSWDAIVSGNNLYVAYNTTTGGQSIKVTYLSSSLVLTSAVTFAGRKATIMSMSVDNTNLNVPIIYAAFYDLSGTTGYVLAIDSSLATVLAPTQFLSSGTILNLTSSSSHGRCVIYTEVSNNYGYDSTIPTHYINNVIVTQSGSVGSTTITIKSVGLASKSFILNSKKYFLAVYSSSLQPTYFLVNASDSTFSAPIIVSKLAYSNGGGYLTTGLPNCVLNGDTVQCVYLFKDLVTSVNKDTNVPAGTQVNGIYSQTGINTVNFSFSPEQFGSVEIADTLNISGGFLWMYDGYLPVEQNFFVYPDNVEASPVNSGGSMDSLKYFYQAVYEWTDNQGNAHKSAPSIPVEVDMTSGNLAFTQPSALTPTAAFTINTFTMVVSSATGLKVGQIVTDTTTPASIQAGTYITKVAGTTITVNLPFAGTSTTDSLSVLTINSATINIPTLRLTYKIANPVKISLYRWSTNQQSYFQVTSITTPLLNDTSVDYVTYTDTLADSSILGNVLIYTTGGVVENINAPASDLMTLWNTRLWLVDAEDQNLLFFSKPVIENVPVETSDLFTLYVAPTIGASGPTGVIKAIGAMDDKLILFKANAINFVSGTGPDITGANNLYSDPIFITSIVGCSNQRSIVNTPNGLMFQSDKGIWLLDRSLGTSYIGAPVEDYTLTAKVLSSTVIPGTNQVRFTLDSGITLMYDYYFGQWSTFTNVPGISSCVYQGLHTYLDKYGQVFQETPGVYLDGSKPVLTSFTTNWINLAGIQSYQRIYEFSLLGDYVSPHFLDLRIAYDFQSPTQQSVIRPTNFIRNYGSDSLFGQTSPFGGPGNLESWRIHTNTQKCQTFQITCNEVYDPQFGDKFGAGLTLSGINCVIGVKKTYRPYKASNSVG